MTPLPRHPQQRRHRGHQTTMARPAATATTAARVAATAQPPRRAKAGRQGKAGLQGAAVQRRPPPSATPSPMWTPPRLSAARCPRTTRAGRAGQGPRAGSCCAFWCMRTVPPVTFPSWNPPRPASSTRAPWRLWPGGASPPADAKDAPYPHGYCCPSASTSPAADSRPRHSFCPKGCRGRFPLVPDAHTWQNPP